MAAGFLFLCTTGILLHFAVSGWARFCDAATRRSLLLQNKETTDFTDDTDKRNGKRDKLSLFYIRAIRAIRDIRGSSVRWLRPKAAPGNPWFLHFLIAVAACVR